MVNGLIVDALEEEQTAFKIKKQQTDKGNQEKMESIKNSLVRQIGSVALTIGTLGVSSIASAAIVNDMDTIVQGSLSIGIDCTASENFAADTFRIKENNLGIHFDDTSKNASFPENDWRILINDATNGGDNYFGIEDSTAGIIPFRVEAGAHANALSFNSLIV